MPTKRMILTLVAVAIGTLPLAGCMSGPSGSARAGYSTSANTTALTPPGQASAIHR